MCICNIYIYECVCIYVCIYYSYHLYINIYISNYYIYSPITNFVYKPKYFPDMLFEQVL